ncbi:hypothetical protein C8Q76DRAFT_767681 [Earliella scabrosa]|nr:hypothetical protein C8Q76DRAFT_767681 [Earliella scabrosa]
MQFSAKFATLAFALLGSFASGVVGVPTADAAPYIVSHEQMMHWLATTDANITYVGEPLNPLAPRAAQTTTVTYCSSRQGNTCGGACSVYVGNPTCLRAPNTNCLMATNDVQFCNTAGCGGICNRFSTCGVRLDGGFCYTPGTQAIRVLV